MNNSDKLDISIQNFDFVTNDKFTELERRLEEQHREMYGFFSQFDSAIKTQSNEFHDYKEFVDNVYLRIPRGIGRIRKLLFRIIFGVKFS